MAMPWDAQGPETPRSTELGWLQGCCGFRKGVPDGSYRIQDLRPKQEKQRVLRAHVACWYWLSLGLEVLGSKATIAQDHSGLATYGSLLKDWLDHGLPDV